MSVVTMCAEIFVTSHCNHRRHLYHHRDHQLAHNACDGDDCRSEALQGVGVLASVVAVGGDGVGGTLGWHVLQDDGPACQDGQTCTSRTPGECK